ncbi:MAG TPA: hypothetical protein PK977_01450, partial [Chitinophagaceae bacterium]|nr:hypothetical protein [Chitinophagaceae bacterium]
MDNKSREEFYNYASTLPTLETLQNIQYLINDLPAYRAQKFNDQFEGIVPFKKKFLYTSCHWVFEGFIY